jgi:hypothetical protein
MRILDFDYLGTRMPGGRPSHERQYNAIPVLLRCFPKRACGAISFSTRIGPEVFAGSRACRNLARVSRSLGRDLAGCLRIGRSVALVDGGNMGGRDAFDLEGIAGVARPCRASGSR